MGSGFGFSILPIQPWGTHLIPEFIGTHRFFVCLRRNVGVTLIVVEVGPQNLNVIFFLDGLVKLQRCRRTVCVGLHGDTV